MLDYYVSQVLLNGPEGELDAEGLTFESPLDMRYTKSSVCESLKLISRFYNVPFSAARCEWSTQGCGMSRTLTRAIGNKGDVNVLHPALTVTITAEYITDFSSVFFHVCHVSITQVNQFADTQHGHFPRRRTRTTVNRFSPRPVT